MARRYVSSPVRAQHRWSGGFYTGEPDPDRIRQFGEQPHGWGNFETNYDLPRAEPHPMDACDIRGRVSGDDTGMFDAVRRSHRGKGPKGWRRSDARTREIICERLTDDPRIDASDIEVRVTDGQVRLTGAVPERRMKYVAEDLAEQCGAQDLVNELWVGR